MGRRSRKRRNPQPPSERGQTPSVAPTQISRSEARDERIRQSLEPLETGERPQAVTIAAVVAVLLGLGNIAMLLAGVEVRGREPGAGGTLLFAAIMFVAAAGMWRAKYWAVLGFQALLAITLVVAGLSLMVASDAFAVVLCVAILAFGGWLFWKLIRALARLQMPERRSQAGDV